MIFRWGNSAFGNWNFDRIYAIQMCVNNCQPYSYSKCENSIWKL